MPEVVHEGERGDDELLPLDFEALKQEKHTLKSLFAAYCLTGGRSMVLQLFYPRLNFEIKLLDDECLNPGCLI